MVGRGTMGTCLQKQNGCFADPDSVSAVSTLCLLLTKNNFNLVLSFNMKKKWRVYGLFSFFFLFVMKLNLVSLDFSDNSS